MTSSMVAVWGQVGVDLTEGVIGGEWGPGGSRLQLVAHSSWPVPEVS